MIKSIKTKKLDELCDVTSSKRIYASEYKDEGVPFYRGKEIIEKQKGNLEVSTEIFISEERYKEIKENYDVPKPGDLLLTSVGTLGVPYVIDNGERFYFKDGNLIWFKNFDGLNSKYLYYWFLSPQGEAQLKRSTIGSSQSAFTITLLRDVEIELPSLDTQTKIASTLSAFDNLIENNSRRIEILEEMARRIYREWFVHFRYPGHENDDLVDSGTELGDIPEGWEVKKFGDLVEYDRDRVKNEDVEEEVSVLGLGDMPKESINLSEWENTDDIGSTKLRFKEDDILFGKIRPYFHKVGFAQVNGVCSSDIFVWRPKEKEDFVLALLASSSDKFVEVATNSSSGTKMPRAKWDVLEKYLIAYPPEELLQKLNLLVGSSLQQIRTLSFQNKRLKETRDLLLPKLISGKIDVEKLHQLGNEGNVD
ncbi:restriction endonuclease subunit S [Fodinibius sp. Rm-B-1B1-1]|uniref:restriction endonuclease subunit S n=1 Tax=Fodinibius alkaliphilus TaxID=3140241 RepID=UPI00315A07CD